MLLDAKALLRSAVFVSDLLPMLPSLRFGRGAPVRRRTIPFAGAPDAELFLPAGDGTHPGVVISLGVVPNGVEHPQVARLGDALARSGFAALMVWSTAMRDLRLDDGDIERLAGAYRWLLAQPEIDRERCGLIGTCVGGSFALLAAAEPSIRDDVAIVATFAPFASLEQLAAEIGSRTRSGGQLAWEVDPLTWKVFVRTLTEDLPSEDRELLRSTLAAPGSTSPQALVSEAAQAVAQVIHPKSMEHASAAVEALPEKMRARIARLSPIDRLGELRARSILIAHDRDDPVIPVEHSRRLAAALQARPGFEYREFTMFRHMDPTKANVSRIVLVRELIRFVAIFGPVFRLREKRPNRSRSPRFRLVRRPG